MSGRSLAVNFIAALMRRAHMDRLTFTRTELDSALRSEVVVSYEAVSDTYTVWAREQPKVIDAVPVPGNGQVN